VQSGLRLRFTGVHNARVCRARLCGTLLAGLALRTRLGLRIAELQWGSLRRGDLCAQLCQWARLRRPDGLRIEYVCGRGMRGAAVRSRLRYGRSMLEQHRLSIGDVQERSVQLTRQILHAQNRRGGV